MCREHVEDGGKEVSCAPRQIPSRGFPAPMESPINRFSSERNVCPRECARPSIDVEIRMGSGSHSVIGLRWSYINSNALRTLPTLNTPAS
jgi:hypothetical protein